MTTHELHMLRSMISLFGQEGTHVTLVINDTPYKDRGRVNRKCLQAAAIDTDCMA